LVRNRAETDRPESGAPACAIGYQNDLARLRCSATAQKAGLASIINEEKNRSRQSAFAPVRVGYRRRSGRPGRIVGAAESDPERKSHSFARTCAGALL